MERSKPDYCICTFSRAVCTVKEQAAFLHLAWRFFDTILGGNMAIESTSGGSLSDR